MRTPILALGLSLVLGAPAAFAAPAEKEVQTALDVWKQAMIKKDKAAFDKVLHPDLTYGHSSGNIQNKAEAIKQVVEGHSQYTAITFGPDTKIRVQGKTALVTGKVDYLEKNSAGKESPVNLVVLTVWVKSPAGWQMIARQATKPAPATPAQASTAAAAHPAPAAAPPPK
jgi:ketosteroid isomerase-like protein